MSQDGENELEHEIVPSGRSGKLRDPTSDDERSSVKKSRKAEGSERTRGKSGSQKSDEDLAVTERSGANQRSSKSQRNAEAGGNSARRKVNALNSVFLR